MAYNLYDFAAHPYRLDMFLVEHINDLRTVDFCFALNSLAMFLRATGAKDSLLAHLKDKYRGIVELVRFSRAGWDGISCEYDILRHEKSLVEWLDRNKDTNDIKMFVSHSFLCMSAFQVSTFIQLSPSTQYMLLKTIQGCVVDVGRNYRGTGQDVSVFQLVCGEIVCALLRQLLAVNRVDMFNWVVDVLELKERYGSSTVLLSAIRETLSKMIPKSIGEMVEMSTRYDAKERVSYEEVVFEMNLLETRFEPSNLFLYIYLDNDYLLQGMRENKELMEFFSLPFDWDELAWLKDDFKVNLREWPF